MGNRQISCFSCFDKQSGFTKETLDIAGPIAFAPMEQDIKDSILISNISKEEPIEEGPFSRETVIDIIETCQEKFLDIVRKNFEEEKYTLEHKQEGIEVFTKDTEEGCLIVSR